MASIMRSTKLAVACFSPFTIRLNCILGCTRFSRSQSTSASTENESEYSETPEYPPLFDASYQGLARKKRQVLYDKIKAMPTVEEKLFEFCLDSEGKKRLSYSVVSLNPFENHYNILPFKLFATRTSLKEGLPDVYRNMNVDALAEHIKPVVLNGILDAFEGITEKMPQDDVEETLIRVLHREDRRRGQMMTDYIFRAVIAALSSQLPHLRDCQIDYLPRCDAFWIAGGFDPTTFLRNFRKRTSFAGIPPDAPMDAKLQYTGLPYLQLRNTLPLPPFVDRDDPLCTTYDVPEYGYQTAYSGQAHRVRYPTNLPGFWPGDPYGFGSLTVFTTECLRNLINLFGKDCCQKMVHSCGVISSFGWLVGLANLKGFTAYQELTYPLATQTVLTNGKHWSFYAYQLNAMCLHADMYNKEYQNICWATNGMKLFDTVENGRVVGYNDEVVKLFIKFLVHAPQKREGVNLSPYLQSVEHADDDEDWSRICGSYKRYYANKGFRLPYGPCLWETIYKVKFNTRLR